jgi:hypothetical protein
VTPRSAEAGLRRRQDVVFQASGADTLPYDPVADAVHVLNAAALAVWELGDGQHTAAEMANALRAHFAGTESRDLDGDVQATLARFRAEGLLT